nr:hypothetical protein [Flavisolibacter nicotianae]
MQVTIFICKYRCDGKGSRGVGGRKGRAAIRAGKSRPVKRRAGLSGAIG